MKKKIWVIDDDISILNVIKIILENEGYNVLEFSDTKLFKEKLEEELPDLILIDIWMPGEDGQKIVKSLKSNTKTKNIPVFMVSALSDTKKMAEKVGADGFIAKPFDIDDLLARVGKYLKE